MSVLWTGCQSTKINNRMNRLFLSLFLVVVCALAASLATCIVDDKKDDSGVHVIRLDPGDVESSEAGIIEIHIPSENRRKRETSPKGTEKTCKKNGECSPGKKCDLKTSKCRDNKPAKISTVEPTEKHGVKSQQKY